MVQHGFKNSFPKGALSDQGTNVMLTEDQIQKKLWDIFLDRLLNSSKLAEEIKAEHVIFAKAIDRAEELFKHDAMIKEMINKNTIFRKLIDFLVKAHGNEENIPTFKLILRTLGNFIDIEEESRNEELEPDQRKELRQEEEEDH